MQVTGRGFPVDFITAAWQQYRQGSPFDPKCDRIGLVTRGRVPKFEEVWHDIKTWCSEGKPALAHARIAASAKHLKVFDSIRNPGKQNDDAPSVEDVIDLIERIEVFPSDFQLTPSSSADQAIGRVRNALVSEDLIAAQSLWKDLVQRAQEARLGSGVVDLASLLAGLRDKYPLHGHPSVVGAWARLDAISADYRGRIETTLPNGYEITRDFNPIRAALRDRSAVLIAGESGVGKSALVKTLLARDSSRARQLWLNPEILAQALSEARRGDLGLNLPFTELLERTEQPENVLVLDAMERADGSTLTALAGLLRVLRERHALGNMSWRAIVIAQWTGFEAQLHPLLSTTGQPILLERIDAEDVRSALLSSAHLRWAASNDNLLAALSNPRTLAWVVSSAAVFAQGDPAALAAPTIIADRLWDLWTGSKATLQAFVMRLAERDANFERSFALSELDVAELAAWDTRPRELPLALTARNRIEFQHDLASDWARYQRLKEIGHDIPRWSALASQPLWIAALRLFGQFLLRQQDQASDGWDRAFAELQRTNAIHAVDILLDALCLDPNADGLLNLRAELLFAENGKLLDRLLNRFLHVATSAAIPEHLSVDPDLRLYLEAEMRVPVFGLWPPLARFLGQHVERIGSLGLGTVSRVAAMWLSTTPLTLGDHPMPFREVMAQLALETARAHQILDIAHSTYGGHDRASKAVFGAALAGANDLPDEVGQFALEMARRRPLSPTSQLRVDEIRAAEGARREALRARQPVRPRQRPPFFIPTSRDLPPWPLGPQGRLVAAFRDAVLHQAALTALMHCRPAIAAEVLLACIVEDHPVEEHSSMRFEFDLGIDSDSESYPTMFWKSAFFTFLAVDQNAALGALRELLDFVMERWASNFSGRGRRPSVKLRMADGKRKTFYGTHHLFEWSQHSELSSGQLFCALDALERWLVAKADDGSDIEPLCLRLLEDSSSVAILGVLANLGKHAPRLFESVLAPLLEVEALYWWDDYRTKNLHFDQFSWYRQGEKVFELARDWTFAPHRKKPLREVASVLAARHKATADRLAKALRKWNVPTEAKPALEQRLLKAELDPANRQTRTDPVTGATEQAVVYPVALQRAVMEYQQAAAVKLQPTTLPYQCQEVIAGNQMLDPESAEYLASLLPKVGAEIADPEQHRMHLAAAAALASKGRDLLRDRPDIAVKVDHLVRTTIEATGSNLSEMRATDEMSGNPSVWFAAVAGLHRALVDDEPNRWAPFLIAILTGRDVAAINGMMTEAARQRDALGAAWWRMLQIGIFAAGLNRLTPRVIEDDREAEHRWNRWLKRLRQADVFGTTTALADVQPLRVAMAVERIELREAGQARPPRLRTGRRRHGLGGLSWHVLNAVFAWLLNREASNHFLSLDEQRALVASLWAFEAWRMEGDADDDGEHDLPSQFGYALLQRAPKLVLASSLEEGATIWQPILELGADGHTAIEHFLSGWFLQLYEAYDADTFMSHWRAMLSHAASVDWTRGRWYRAEEVWRKLLGLDAYREISQASALAGLIGELEPFYRSWASEHLSTDEDNIASFCNFLTSAAGRPFRLPGTVWIRDAIAAGDRFRRTSTGNTISEAMDVVLAHHAADLTGRPDVRAALIEIVAKLVAAQVPPALGLQRRISALR
ncbi:MAG: hypothetical protein QOK17_2687 [Sphingomonadales bacterium]|nr:hypothetical protein [Sphingomonadales bacterium]